MKTNPKSATIRTNNLNGAEAALQESEERFRQLSEAAFEAIILHDNGTILEVNQSFCRMYGYERAEVIGKSVLDLAPPEFRELLLQLVRSRDTDPYEGLALRKDGTIFRAEVAAKPILYQGRNARVAAIRDITDQKRSERRQAAQYAVTRVLSDSATLAEATPQLLKVICESLRWKIGEFWRVCDGTNLLRCEETWHVPGLDATAFIEASRQTELSPGVGLPGRVWQSGQPDWIPDVTTDPRCARAAIAVKVGLRGAVAFPILAGNHTLGVMLFFSRRDPEVDEDLLKIMSAIGSQIGQFSERKLVEEALRRSEQRFAAFMNNTSAQTWIKDTDFRYVYANEQLARLLGRSLNEIVGKNDFDLVPPTTAGQFRANDEAALASDKLLETCETIHDADGDLRWSRVYKFPIQDTDGRPYVGGIAIDITEGKRAEEALRQTEQQYESLVHSIDGIVWELDPRTFSFTFVSKQAERLLGYPSAQWLGDPNFWADHIHPDDREWAFDFCQNSTERREDHQFEYRMIAADGRGVWLKDIVTVSIMDDKSVRLRGVMVDITKRKQAEEALRESEERYRDLVENSREFICTHDLDGLVLSANPAAAAAAGYDLNEYVGKKTIRDLLAPEVNHQFDQYMARLRKEGTTSGIMLVQTKSGERRIWEYYNSLRTEGVAAPVVRGMARDITERMRAEAMLASEKRVLEMIATEASLPDLLETLAREIERQSKGLSCSILLLDADGMHLRHGAAPSLPDAYCRAIDGVAIGPSAGSCGTAAFRKELVVVEDIATDPLWEDYREMALKHGLRACWSTPILTGDGRALGTFAMYYREPRRPGPTELELIELATQLAAIAIERRQAEQALSESEHRYRDIFTFAPVGIYQSLRDGTLITANKALAEMLAYDSVDEFLKVNLADVYFTSDDRQKLIREYEGRGYAGDLELRWKRKDGSPIWVQLSAHAIKGTDGLTKYFEGFVRNITERKLQEEALHESETLLKQSQRVAVLGHYTLDVATGFWTNSEVLDEIFGIDAAYAKNVAGWLDIVHPEQRDEMHAYLRDHVLKERNSFDREYRIVRINDSAVRWVHGLGNLEFNAEGQPARMFGIIQDVTERKQVEEKLNATAEKLRSLSARLQSAREDEGTRIAREIHDELGASLTGLKWDLEGIDKVLSGAGNVAEVQAVRKKLPTMTGLIDSTIDTVRRISAELRPGLLDDLGLVAAIESQASQFQARTGIKCKFVTAADVVNVSSERATAIFRIFQEVLTNVIRHAHATKVNIELRERGGYVELRVKDDGLGITEDEKLDAGSLGLLGMSERALLVGGGVSISGAQGKGTTVLVRVPAGE